MTIIEFPNKFNVFYAVFCPLQGSFKWKRMQSQSVDKFAKTPSFRRKPESRKAVQILRGWIPAPGESRFDGMTRKSNLSTDCMQSVDIFAYKWQMLPILLKKKGVGTLASVV